MVGVGARIAIALSLGLIFAARVGAQDRDRLLVGNSGSDSVVAFDPRTGRYLGEFIAAGSGGLVAPDAMSFGPDGALYVSSGDASDNSAILRFDAQTGAPLGVFARGGGLVRPYGHVFGPDGLLYVSSFMTDQILRYDAQTGEFVDVFASGNGEPGSTNGPNGLAFGPEGLLYVTTEGSVLGTFPGLPSEVLRFEIATKRGETFIAQPEPAPTSPGYVSLLGLVFGPNCPRSCDLFISDFASDIRRYDAQGTLVAQLSTDYTGTNPSSNATGALTFGSRGELFTVGFDQREGAGEIGAILRFEARTGRPRPRAGGDGAVFVGPSARLVRPIGILDAPRKSCEQAGGGVSR